MIKSIRIVLVENGVEREVVFTSDATPPPPPPAPTASLSPASITVEPGQAFTLVWATTDATDVKLNGMPVAAEGSRELALTADATYTLVALGPSGRAEAQAFVSVRPAPTATILVTPPEISAGESVTVTWLTSGAELVSLEHDGTSEPVEAAGTRTFTPGQSTTYTVRSSRPGHPSAAVASVSVVVNAPAPATGAKFLGKDPWTRGSWIDRYGPDGHMIAGLPAALPSYASATLSPEAVLWVGKEHTDDYRALSRPGAPSDRILSNWVAGIAGSPNDPGPFRLDLSLDGLHRVALYCASTHGPEPAERHMMVQAVDPATGDVLDTRHLSDADFEFMHGVWLVYEAAGPVRFVFTRTGTQQRPVLSGVFFGGVGVPTPPPPAGPLSAAVTAPAASEPGLPFKVSWGSANAAILKLDGKGVAFSGERTEELHASHTYTAEAVYPGVPSVSAAATVAVSPPPPTGDGYNVLLRGQSNAQYFAEYGGLARLRELMEARLGKKVNLVYAARHPQKHNTVWTATGFVRGFMSGTTPTEGELGILARIGDVPAADRSRPSLTVWMHNEYDGAEKNPPITQEEATAGYLASMGLARAAWGQPAKKTPYAFVWVPFRAGVSTPAIRATQAAIAADPAAFAYLAPEIAATDMADDNHISVGGALRIAERLAGPLCDILLAADSTPPPAAPTGSLTVEPASVTLGGAATLRWASANASSAALDGAAVPLSGEKAVSPTAPTVYELKLMGPGGEATYRATLDVVTPPPTGSLTVSPPSIVSGQTATLSWASQHATSATLDGAAVPPAGSLSVQPTQGRSYSLVLSGPGGTATYTASVSVSQPPPPPPPPSGVMGTATISVDKSDHVVNLGETVTVTATVTGAVQVWVQSLEGRIDLAPTGGTFTLSPKVSGPFPLLALDANGGLTVKPMSAVVKVDRPAVSPLAPATLTTVKDGALDDPATWGGRLPGFDEVVEVRHTCTYSGRRFWCARLINKGFITVKGGVLHTTDYDDVGQGSLTLDGRDADKALVMLHNRPRHADDADDFWRCARVRGRLVVRGKPATRRLELAAPARVGDTLIRLTSPCQGWGPGQKILLHDTRRIGSQDDGHREEEIAVIRGVGDGGLTVHLLSPVRYDHLPCLEKDGSTAFRPKAFHLIANAGFVTSDPTTVETRCCVRVEDRAHLDMDHWLVHGTGRHSAGPLADRQPYDNNPLGLHNLAGPAGGVGDAVTWADGAAHPPQFRMCNGVSIDPPPVVPMGQGQVSWGILLSNSHFGLVEGNVSFNWGGAGICCLDGNETRNIIRHNSSVCVAPAGWTENRWGSTNVAHTSTGLWFRGGNNEVCGNFASGCERGYVVAPYMRLGYQNMRLPARPGVDPYKGESVGADLRALPLLRFEDNEAGGRLVNAMEMWGVGVDMHGTSPAANAKPSVVKGLGAWRVRDHVYYNYMSSYVTFEDVQAREGLVAFFSSDYMAYRFQLKNVDVRGFNTGWKVSPLYDQSLDGGYFECYVAVEVSPLWVTGMSAQNIPPRRLGLRGLRWARPPGTFPADWGAPSAIRMDGYANTSTGGSNAFNLAGKNEVYVADFQGVAGDDFRAYFAEQAAGAVMPATKAWPGSTQLQVNGCPEAGLTNAQAWAKYGIAWGGEVAPADCVTRDGVTGLVKAN